MTDYMQWQDAYHDDEPRDQQRDLRIPHTWASIGPDARQCADGWSWTILECDPSTGDSTEVADGFASSEEAAKQAIADWEQTGEKIQP